MANISYFKKILSIDIGTSSVRACLFDGDGEMLPRTLVKIVHSPTMASDGSVEFDAVELLSRVEDVINKVTAKTKFAIDAVAMCAFWHGLVGVDGKGKPTTPVLTWADTRSREYTTLLKERFNERVVHNRTGAHFHSSFWPAKLLWLRNEQPDVWKRTARWLSFSDLVAERLFGECVTSISMASATGVFDQRKCDWDMELLRYLKVKRSQLPRVATDGETYRLSRKYARRWPTLANSAWFPAVGDGAADNLGSDCSTKNKAALMVGTSAAMRVAFVGKVPRRIPEGLWCYRIDSTRVIVGGALSDGGNLYALIKKRFGLKGDLENELSRRETPDGLVVIPFFHGERSTGYDENARGAIIGLIAEHDGIDVLRAAMEGVAFRLADIYERLSSLTDITEIVASGGALHQSPTWTQIIADTLGHSLTLNDTDESSLCGAAVYGQQMMP
ncbi:MAG: gluconokinase [Blastocatellia bacterium]|nr:gluconokinase [Blastocatellia bacterium]